MLRFTLPLLLTTALLAGCGVAPQAAVRPAGAIAAKSEARRVHLTVPAHVLDYVADAYKEESAKAADEWVLDMYGRKVHPRWRIEWGGTLDRKTVRVIVSRDGFKTTIDEASYMGNFREVQGRTIKVPFFAKPGAVKYYLEARFTRVEVATNKRTELPVRYVSDLGKNFDGELN